MDILLTLLSISDDIEEKLDPRMEQNFRWRPETAVYRKWEDLHGRFGPEGKLKPHLQLELTDRNRIQSNDGS